MYNEPINQIECKKKCSNYHFKTLKNYSLEFIVNILLYIIHCKPTTLNSILNCFPCPSLIQFIFSPFKNQYLKNWL